MTQSPNTLAPEVHDPMLTHSSDRDFDLWEAGLRESGEDEAGLGLVVELGDTDDQDALEATALQEEPPYRAPDFEPNHAFTEAEYNLLLTERLSIVGQSLDMIRDKITNEADANEWLELKRAVAATKTIGDVYVKVGVVIELESALYDLVENLA